MNSQTIVDTQSKGQKNAHSRIQDFPGDVANQKEHSFSLYFWYTIHRKFFFTIYEACHEFMSNPDERLDVWGEVT